MGMAPRWPSIGNCEIDTLYFTECASVWGDQTYTYIVTDDDCHKYRGFVYGAATSGATNMAYNTARITNQPADAIPIKVGGSSGTIDSSRGNVFNMYNYNFIPKQQKSFELSAIVAGVGHVIVLGIK